MFADIFDTGEGAAEAGDKPIVGKRLPTRRNHVAGTAACSTTPALRMSEIVPLRKTECLRHP
jgi:hypothetical protein